MNWLNPAWVGRAVLAQMAGIGAAAVLFVRLVALTPLALRRFTLVIEQTFFVGNRSLSIIGVSGLFVGRFSDILC